MSTTIDSFLKIMQISDALFPIGSYTQSNGLETYTQKSIVSDAESLRLYLKNTLIYNLKFNDALAVKLSYEYTEEENMLKLMQLDSILYCSKVPLEIKQGSSKQCGRFIKTISKFVDEKFINEYYEKIVKAECNGQYPIAFGIYACFSKVDKKTALLAYLYSCCSSIVNNTAKLIPFSQLEGQKILFDMFQSIEVVSEEVTELEVDELGRSCIGFDIRAMQHENLYSRLFMS